ncbi:MAG: MFS transporter [Acidobacteriota bacterium]
MEAVMHGLYLLWWVEERHVSPALVAAILAAGDLAITLLEVPTGWLADRCGYRLSLIAGSAVQVAGMICCWLGQGVPSLLAACLLVALGDGLRSGADQALLYDTCVARGRPEDFQRIEARTGAVQTAAMVGLVLLGGVIVETWGFAAGWIAETVLCAIGLAIAWAMVEPSAIDGRIVPDAPADSPMPAVAGGFLWALLTLTLPAALLSGAATAVSFWAQTTGGRAPQHLTVLVAAMALAEAAGSALAVRMPPAGVRAQLLLAGCGVAGILAVFAVPSTLVPVVIVLELLLGPAHPLRAAAVQRLAGEGVRARAASIASACDKACDTVALMLAGITHRHRGGR